MGYGMLGKHQTEYRKKVISRINSILQKGKNNSNWKGGFRTKNPNAYLKEWRHKNRYHMQMHSQNQRKKAGRLTIKIIQRVYEDNIKKYGTLTCYLCEKPIKFGKDGLEHKIPISRGGKHRYDNLEIACLRCNSIKSNRTIEEFKKEREI
jgi:5-methylcytosine-specific restriction endonuclease McrA